MIGWRAVVAATTAAAMIAASPAAAQHDGHVHHETVHGITLGGGASAIVVATEVSPGVDGRRLREGYLTQPMLHGHASLFHGALGAQGMVDVEGATLQRGELAPGAYGEGYADRRHPHTWLHELVGSAMTPAFRGAAASIAGGKGFAPFGTDDPMVRPLERFPVNHHLSQILERAVLVAAVRWRLLAFEGGVFNGDEPESPTDAPNASNFADSWARRVTLRPLGGVEIQLSDADVHSPESPTGHGTDHRQRSGSLRLERSTPAGAFYGLAEWATTALTKDGQRASHLGTALFEASLDRGGLRLAARYERSVRPEEERLSNPFRTPYPSAEVQILGTTRFDIATASVSRASSASGFHFAPFIEVSPVAARATAVPAAFVPSEFYGAPRTNVVSIGVRFTAGMLHQRAGRYGVAAGPDDPSR